MNYEAIKIVIVGFLSSLASNVSGFWGVVVKYGSKYLISLVEKFYKKKAIEQKNNEEAKQELEQYNEAVSKPDITKEERLKADRDLIGG